MQKTNNMKSNLSILTLFLALFAMTQLILIEAIRDTTYQYAFNFEAEPTSIWMYHGTIDWLLYQDDGIGKWT